MYRQINRIHRFISKGDVILWQKSRKQAGQSFIPFSFWQAEKAELLLDGDSFLSCQIKKAEKLGIHKVYVSGHAAGADAFRNGAVKSSIHIQMVPDIYRERGPLGGLHACMKAMDTPYCLVLPVDVPQFPEETLEELLLAHENSLGAAASENAGSFGNGREGGNSGKPLLLVHGERTEPLMGIYPVCMADCIGEQIEKASAPVFRVLDAWGFDTFRTSAEEWKMRNINTPEDYRELLAYMEKGKVK